MHSYDKCPSADACLGKCLLLQDQEFKLAWTLPTSDITTITHSNNKAVAVRFKGDNCPKSKDWLHDRKNGDWSSMGSGSQTQEDDDRTTNSYDDINIDDCDDDLDSSNGWEVISNFDSILSFHSFKSFANEESMCHKDTFDFLNPSDWEWPEATPTGPTNFNAQQPERSGMEEITSYFSSWKAITGATRDPNALIFASYSSPYRAFSKKHIFNKPASIPFEGNLHELKKHEVSNFSHTRTVYPGGHSLEPILLPGMPTDCQQPTSGRSTNEPNTDTPSSSLSILHMSSPSDTTLSPILNVPSAIPSMPPSLSPLPAAMASPTPSCMPSHSSTHFMAPSHFPSDSPSSGPLS